MSFKNIVQKIISGNSQRNGAIVGTAGAKALGSSEYIDSNHRLGALNSDQSTNEILGSLKNRYDYINYYDGKIDPARHLFANNEQGLWLDPSDMTAGKAGWRRNLLTYSEQLTTSPWSANEASLESATPPSGIGLAWKLKETGNSGVHFVGRVLNTVLSASVQHTLSVYAKAGERNILSIVGESTATTLCDFDLSAGTAHPAASATGTITSVGDGWYRCSMTWTATASPSTTYFATKQSLAGGLVFTGTLNSGLFLAAAQLERASTPTEYQPITDFSTEFKAAFPTHTLYQDSNGVTPCTAASQPVGLILDQSRGGLGALGPELVTNGDFASGQTGWIDSPVAPSGWSFTGGALVGSNAAGGYEQAIQVTSGKWYRCTITLSNVSAGAVSFAIAGAGTGPVFNSNGTNTVLINAGSTGNIGIVRRTSNFTGTIDNISVREVPGNHASQSSSSARPTLARIPSSGRRNLLTRTEEFDNAAWTKTSATISANAGTAPDGLVKADKFIPGNAITANNASVASSTITASPSQTWTFTFKAKADGQTSVQTNIQLIGAVGNYRGSVNLSTGVYSNIISTGWATPSAIVTDLGSGWYQISITGTTPASTTGFACLISNNATGNGTDGVLITDAQAEQSATATNYQKVVATTDVTESGVSDLWHLVFDGSDDSLVTNAVDFATWTQETRRNLLTETESFNGWTLSNATLTSGISDPEGGTTAFTLTATASTGLVRLLPSVSSGVAVVQSIWIRRRTGTGNVTSYRGQGLTSTTLALTSDWQRLSVTGTTTGTNDAAGIILATSGDAVDIWHPQFELGSVATDYQRVGTDEMTVIAGVRKLSDAAPGACVELTSSPNANNGTFTLLVPAGASATIGYYSRGTGQQGGDATISAPVSAVCSGLSDISSDVTQLRINGTLQVNDTDDQGTGNYSNAAIYIGRRGGASVPFNGHIYGLIIRGVATDIDQIEQMENFMKRRTGLTY